MTLSIHSIRQSRIEIDNLRGKISFVVDMSEEQLQEFILLIGNPWVDRIVKRSWAQKLLNISHAEAVELVDAATNYHRNAYDA
jgi:hypothetical protein